MQKEGESELTRDISGFGEVTLRVYIERYRGSKDEVVVHTYTGDPPDRDHEVFRFVITDESDQLCRYKTTRGEPEPSNLGLWALQEYGWDCTNFDIPSDGEEATEVVAQLGEIAEAVGRVASGHENPMLRQLGVEAWVRLYLMSQLGSSPDGHDILDFIGGESDEDDEAPVPGTAIYEGNMTVPGYFPPSEKYRASKLLVDRLQQLVEEHTDSTFAIDNLEMQVPSGDE